MKAPTIPDSGIRLRMATNAELDALDQDQRRDKARPDRRRRMTIEVVRRLRYADELLGDFESIMGITDRMPGEKAVSAGAVAEHLHDLRGTIAAYKKLADGA